MCGDYTYNKWCWCLKLNSKKRRGLGFWSLQPNVAPQFGHLLWRRARQKRIPRGKKNMAHMIPRQVKSSSSTPTLHRTHVTSVIYQQTNPALLRLDWKNVLCVVVWQLQTLKRIVLPGKVKSHSLSKKLVSGWLRNDCQPEEFCLSKQNGKRLFITDLGIRYKQRETMWNNVEEAKNLLPHCFFIHTVQQYINIDQCGVRIFIVVCLILFNCINTASSFSHLYKEGEKNEKINKPSSKHWTYFV